MNDDKKRIKTTKKIYPQIYSYILPDVSENEGWQKVGYTERKDVDARILEQTQTAAIKLRYQKLWSASSFFKSTGQFFTDKDLHKYYVKNGIAKSQKQDDGGLGEEWFYFDGTPEVSKKLFDEYAERNYFNQVTGKIPYELRKEQAQAVSQTLSYAEKHQTTDFSIPNEQAKFLWNAKPRFGKTLSSYDFAKKFNAKNVLIVTNRPAIANSWFDDFEKFIDGYYFISTTDSLKERRTLTRDEFLNRANASNKDKQITFLSLQDLKGGQIFGGNHDKLEWVATLNWDLLIVDEAHEGVDTERTDKAFDKIKRRFTLHLSGTPFKAIADGYFKEDQIFNWTYIDEQKAKQAELKSGNDAGDHVNLPDMRLFTYKMSDMISERLEEGMELDDENIDFAFELNEMFATDVNGRFIHENDILTFLNQLTYNEKYPFSTPELRAELKHTFWLVGNRVASAKAMEKLLRNHPVFGEYKIILAAGDGRPQSDDDSSEEEMRNINANEKAFDRVKKAIKENDRTITLSVGQLTTGVTIEEWSAVLMLSDIKSESLYMQAIFRSQNPYKFTNNDGDTYRKKSAYVFDFSPNRVLRVYDKFANSLLADVAQGEATEKIREQNVAELLNYFPVLAEDKSGEMIELSAEQVLTFPKAIIAKEVVNRGFVTNLLFVNIGNVFSIPSEVISALNKASSTNDTGRQTKNEEINHNPDRKSKRDHRISVNKDKILGNKVYGTKMQEIIASASTEETKEEAIQKIIDDYMNEAAEPFEAYKTIYSPSTTEFEELQDSHLEKVKEIAEEYVSKDLTDSRNQTELAEKLSELIEKDLPNDLVVHKEEENYQEEEMSEMDQIRKKLRTFTRAIPSFVMASKNVDKITLDNIEDTVSDEDFEELFTENDGMPFTKDDFRMIRGPWTNPETGEVFEGFFDRYTFNAAIREFEEKRQEVADYLHSGAKEDIFSYIRPLKTNQIFTPRRVVNQMLDALERDNPSIFTNPDITFCDPYVKSGLYISEIAKRLNRGLEERFPNQDERIRHIFEKQLYGFAPTRIIYDIARKYVYGGYPDVKTDNLKQLDLTDNFKKGEILNMKFDVIVGNPPYQEKNANNKMSRSIYPIFAEQATKIAKIVSLIMPARWMSGEDGPYRETSGFVSKMKSYGIKSFVLFPNSQDVFSGVDVKGGICHFIIERGYIGKVKYSLIDNKKIFQDEVEFGNKLDDNIIIRFPELISIVEKIDYSVGHDKITEPINASMKTLVSSWNPFGFISDFFVKNNEKVSRISEKQALPDDYKIIGLIKGKREFRYIPNEALKKNIDGAKAYKVFIPRANGSGVFGEVFSTPMLGSPMLICTDTFLQVGQFDNSVEAENLLKYVKTKFFRAMVGVKKTAVFNYKDAFSFVPIQNFTSESDIDWSKSIEEVDKQLYKKYNLSDKEIAFIEEKVRPME